MNISTDIGELLDDPRPVMALNLMGFSLLLNKDVLPTQFMFWPDGVAAVLALRARGMTIQRKPGRDVLTGLFDGLDERRDFRRVVILGDNEDYAVCHSRLGLPLKVILLPYFNFREDVENFDLSVIDKKDLVILAIGSPKQEWLASHIWQKTGAKVFALGGALNMLEGREKVCPRILQNVWMEWLYRLWCNPKTRFARLKKITRDGLIGAYKVNNFFVSREN